MAKTSALLWHRLMGKGVLGLTSFGSPHLRAYAHCSKGRVRSLHLYPFPNARDLNSFAFMSLPISYYLPNLCTIYICNVHL